MLTSLILKLPFKATPLLGIDTAVVFCYINNLFTYSLVFKGTNSFELSVITTDTALISQLLCCIDLLLPLSP